MNAHTPDGQPVKIVYARRRNRAPVFAAFATMLFCAMLGMTGFCALTWYAAFERVAFSIQPAEMQGGFDAMLANVECQPKP